MLDNLREKRNDPLIAPLSELDSFMTVLGAVKKKKTPVLATGVIDAQKSHLARGLCDVLNHSALIVTHSELHAREIAGDMRFFAGANVKHYPAKDIIFYSADVHSLNITKERLDVLRMLLESRETGASCVVVASVEALFDRLSPAAVFAGAVITVAEGDVLNLDALAQKLVNIGYERAELVEAPGQFAVRGGIADIFPCGADNALRLEFWDDEVDSVRLLDTQSQRSVEKVNGRADIYPMDELIISGEALGTGAAAIEKDFLKAHQKLLSKGQTEEADNLKDAVSEALEKLRENHYFSGVDAYSPYFYGGGASLFDYLPDKTIVFFDEPNKVKSHAEAVSAEFAESIQNRILKGYLLPKQGEMIFGYGDVLSFAGRFPQVLYALMTQSQKDFAVKEVVHFAVKATVTLKQRFDLFADDLKFYCKNGFRAAVVSASHTRGRRLADEMRNLGLSADFKERAELHDLKPGAVTVLAGSLNKGFEYQHINFVLLTDKELFAGEKKRKAAKKKKGSKIESFTDLTIGDYVVHDNHGIGVYRGIEQIVQDGVAKDYLKLSYADGGNLYVHTSQMDMIQKYIGGEGVKLKLNKLGGADWVKAKAKTRKAVEVLAKDLIELYAKRQAAEGFTYSGDTVWQKEFEELFPFEETDDQLMAIEDVKKDMESGRVMDRLICGDVGYGKTEVALRAAFKAAQDGKQVAYLVPTTILAQQHYNTFVQRMKDYPIGIEMLSRFRSKRQQEESLAKIAAGSSDIAIGTHRLLSADVKFKNLGLIIVDEEQRFGVAHKEKLKQMKANADVMTLTATPIPRTLHMSLSGIRDMSLLEEPPQERQPVQTYVMEYNPEFVKDAINREVSRGGQVYVLHNRVRNIPEVAARVQALVPEVSVAFAHGQMSEHQLENIMVDFINGDIQVLVCTTIIETGLDIPNANTIVILDADYMGLSQLYQLRGRVGRSNRQAYAYLMYRKDKVLQENAEKRLQTIREFTEFGSGFRIAMRDMEIRGAGNILGGEQHGHMDAVGYDMYCKLLGEAVRELKDEPVPEEFETTIDININAYIPPYYIQNEARKLEIYKKIALIQNEQDYFDVQEEIEDRFGNLPGAVQNLLEIALLKAYAHRLGIVSVTHSDKSIVMTFKADAKADPNRIMKVVSEHPLKIMFSVKRVPKLVYNIDGDRIDFWEMKDLLKEMSEEGDSDE